MHRIIVGTVAVALALVAAGPLTAQDWYLGVEGGLNISDLDVEEEELDSETGLIRARPRLSFPRLGSCSW